MGVQGQKDDPGVDSAEAAATTFSNDSGRRSPRNIEAQGVDEAPFAEGVGAEKDFACSIGKTGVALRNGRHAAHDVLAAEGAGEESVVRRISSSHSSGQDKEADETGGDTKDEAVSSQATPSSPASQGKEGKGRRRGERRQKPAEVDEAEAEDRDGEQLADASPKGGEPRGRVDAAGEGKSDLRSAKGKGKGDTKGKEGKAKGEAAPEASLPSGANKAKGTAKSGRGKSNGVSAGSPSSQGGSSEAAEEASSGKGDIAGAGRSARGSLTAPDTTTPPSSHPRKIQLRFVGESAANGDDADGSDKSGESRRLTSKREPGDSEGRRRASERPADTEGRRRVLARPTDSADSGGRGMSAEVGGGGGGAAFRALSPTSAATAGAVAAIAAAKIAAAACNRQVEEVRRNSGSGASFPSGVAGMSASSRLRALLKQSGERSAASSRLMETSVAWWNRGADGYWGAANWGCWSHGADGLDDASWWQDWQGSSWSDWFGGDGSMHDGGQWEGSWQDGSDQPQWPASGYGAAMRSELQEPASSSYMPGASSSLSAAASSFRAASGNRSLLEPPWQKEAEALSWLAPIVTADLRGKWVGEDGELYEVQGTPNTTPSADGDAVAISWLVTCRSRRLGAVPSRIRLDERQRRLWWQGCYVDVVKLANSRDEIAWLQSSGSGGEGRHAFRWQRTSAAATSSTTNGIVSAASSAPPATAAAATASPRTEPEAELPASEPAGVSAPRKASKPQPPEVAVLEVRYGLTDFGPDEKPPDPNAFARGIMRDAGFEDSEILKVQHDAGGSQKEGVLRVEVLVGAKPRGDVDLEQVASIMAAMKSAREPGSPERAPCSSMPGEPPGPAAVQLPSATARTGAEAPAVPAATPPEVPAAEEAYSSSTAPTPAGSAQPEAPPPPPAAPPLVASAAESSPNASSAEALLVSASESSQPSAASAAEPREPHAKQRQAATLSSRGSQDEAAASRHSIDAGTRRTASGRPPSKQPSDAVVSSSNGCAVTADVTGASTKDRRNSWPLRLVLPALVVSWWYGGGGQAGWLQSLEDAELLHSAAASVVATLCVLVALRCRRV
eukprot:TRINITY_DN7483_c0_g1_i1.p1 TRINITY_DN7483_c0_g1~~TRINITY_DN7483_c0_g1_i1.p1  ORF type:complete len:1072 (-),score=258.37 TRINITY_DN7483_c0_g1_i1:124-3339(-)